MRMRIGLLAVLLYCVSWLLPGTAQAFWWGGPPWGYYPPAWSPAWGNYYGPGYGAPPPWLYGPYGYPGAGYPSATRSGQRFDPGYVAQLKSQLGVRPGEQETAWNALVQAIQQVPGQRSILTDKEVQVAYQKLFKQLDPQQQVKAEAFRNAIVW
ncbi:MAG: hypothetical protein HQL58_09075 [Magnetococcales bacterium]|nr:hypothetical protein [Magnetococcales bacterium]